jgi:hypothetical protein
MLIAHPCRQPETAGQDTLKRWFSDLNNDLFVWLNKQGQVIAFQFSYNKTDNEHLLSWSEQQDYSHGRIDDGEDVCQHLKMSPIMVSTGTPDYAQVAEIFRGISASLEPGLVEFIYRKLAAPEINHNNYKSIT